MGNAGKGAILSRERMLPFFAQVRGGMPPAGGGGQGAAETAAIEILVIPVHHILEERNIAVWYAAAAAGFYQTVQGITRILMEHAFHNKNLVTISCGAHHTMIQCVGDSSTERGCKHEVQADKASKVGQTATAHADDQGAAGGPGRICGRLLQDRQESVCDITTICVGLCVQRQGQDAHAYAGAGGSFLGHVGAAPAAVTSHYTTRSRGLRPAAAAAPLTSCGIAGTPQRQKGGLHHDSQH